MSEQPKAVEKRLPTLGLCAIVDGRLMGDIGEVYEAVSYFVGRPAFTHELPKYSRLASGRIAEAFPEMSGREQDSWEQVRDDVLAKYSTEVAVPPDWAGCVADGKSAIENVSDAMLAARAKAPS